jgi:hypothetical protein
MTKTSKSNTSKKPVRFIVNLLPPNSSIDVDGDVYKVDDMGRLIIAKKGYGEVFRCNSNCWVYVRAVFNRE